MTEIKSLTKEEAEKVKTGVVSDDPNRFELTIDMNELRKKSIFLATPMYGGQCAGLYTRSVIALSEMCMKYGIKLQIYFMFNESLITRARNYSSDEFYRSGCTHLMFIDSDIGFDPNDVIALLALQTDESPYDVISGVYPKKCLSFEKMIAAVNRGLVDENPNDLENYVGDYVFNPLLKEGQNSILLNRPAEVMETGTGFMMIRRKTFEDYRKHYPELLYRPDHVRTEHFDGSREIMAYFDAAIDPDSRRYLSEDYFFCKNVRRFGGQIWICPWMKLQHVGSYVFGGSLAALAAAGASPTADPTEMEKIKKANKANKK